MMMETGKQNPKTLPEEEYKRKYWILPEGMKERISPMNTS
jgi:hypothetical protein